MVFEWDAAKDRINWHKHGIDFATASKAFKDPHRVYSVDVKHSTEHEVRWYCFGQVEQAVLTVRFTIREGKIRIFGAGYWREGQGVYDKENR